MSDTTLARIGGIQALHLAELDAGHFLIQHCASCGKHVYYPREVCPHCSSDELSLVAPNGTGSVYATTTVRRKADAGGDYNVSLINLDEGVRLMSRVDNLAPDAVTIGLRVKARVEVSDGKGIVLFDALEGGTA